VLPPSSLYALGAFEAGCPFINFTSSTGVDVPAVRERADQLGLPYMGRDGKTGETLVKSVLAPMFSMRNLSVLSWVGQNILGNCDGANLTDARVRAAKLRTKDKTVSQILGKSTTTRVSIDYVPSLDDWKVAWDFIHFEGFLGTRMSLQFTWQGSDSLLAAPLIIDLARLAALACRSGDPGPMRHLACFFKDPMDVQEKDLFTQWGMLVRHVGGG
jgi:myo-inositol-1-phosphate synthase